MIFQAKNKTISIDRTFIMGILNVTPDSFSDGGKWNALQCSIEHASQMEREGADIIDIGGQSTRPGFTVISPEAEKERVVPVLKDLREKTDLPISADTFYYQVAQEAVGLGADIINDVTGFADKNMIEVAAASGAGCIVMHNADIAACGDAVAEVCRFFEEKAKEMIDAGVRPECICLDPGIGFGKTYVQNLEMIKGFREFSKFGFATMSAASRKRVIGQPCGNPPFQDRLYGTIAAHTISVYTGANIIRVHDVAPSVQAARVADAVVRGE